MKKIALLSFGVIGLTLFSFKSFEGGKLTLLKDGNYYAPAGVVSVEDAKILSNIGVSAKGGCVVQTKVYKDAVDRNIWKEAKFQDTKDKAYYTKVMSVVSRYL
jgi:hypothetical protein